MDLYPHLPANLPFTNPHPGVWQYLSDPAHPDGGVVVTLASRHDGAVWISLSYPAPNGVQVAEAVLSTPSEAGALAAAYVRRGLAAVAR